MLTNTGGIGSDLNAAAREKERQSPLAMDSTTFRALGHRLVEQLADLLESVPGRRVNTD